MLFNTSLIVHLTTAKRREVSLARCALVSALLCCVLAPLPLSAQTAGDEQPAETKEPAPAEQLPAEQPRPGTKQSETNAPASGESEKTPIKEPEQAPEKTPEKSPVAAPEKQPAGETKESEEKAAQKSEQKSEEKAPADETGEAVGETDPTKETADATKTSEATDGEAEKTETEAGEATAAEDSATKRLVYYGRRENSRLRWHFGFGRGEFKAGVVSAASPAWFLNSAIRTGADPTYQPAIPVEPGGIGKHWSFQTGLQWAYKDRFFFSFNWYWIDQPLGGSNSTTVSFLHPPQSRFRYSYFEGLRLANYKEDHKDFEFKYLTPFRWRGFKAGFHIAREFYEETNDISYGSFQATNGDSPIEPNSRAWSIGGIVPNTYEMKGWALGPSFRYKIFNWFTMYYQLSLLWDRTGNFTQAGLQTLTVQNDVTNASRAEVLAPIAGGTAKDSGLRHRLEAEFSIYCRYTVTVGILKEDFEREYETYGGYTYGSVPYFYSQQTAVGLGIGETSQPHEVSKQEIYVKFGVDFFFGGAESEQRVYNNAYRGGGGSGCPVNRRAG